MASSANFLEEALNTDVDQSAVNAIVGSLETQLTTQSSQINMTTSNANSTTLKNINNNNNNSNTFVSQYQQHLLNQQQIQHTIHTQNNNNNNSVSSNTIMPKNEPVKVVYPASGTQSVSSASGVLNMNNNRVTFTSAPLQNGTITLSQLTSQSQQHQQQHQQQNAGLMQANIKITGTSIAQNVGGQPHQLIFKNATSSAPGTIITSSTPGIMTMSKTVNNQATPGLVTQLPPNLQIVNVRPSAPGQQAQKTTNVGQQSTRVVNVINPQIVRTPNSTAISLQTALQGIPAQGNTLILKSDNGQYQLLRIGPAPAAGNQLSTPGLTTTGNQTIRLQTVPAVSRFTGPPLALRKTIVTQQSITPHSSSTNTIIVNPTITTSTASQQILTTQTTPIVSVAQVPALTTQVQQTNQQQQLNSNQQQGQQTIVVTSNQALNANQQSQQQQNLNSNNSTTVTGTGTSVVVTQQPPQRNDNAKEKCRKFLTNLIELSKREPKNVEKNVRTLIQELVDANVEPEDFCKKLEHLLNASPQPCLIGFLKKSLPLLRQSLVTKEISIEGINPPSPMVAFSGSTITTTQIPAQIRPVSQTVIPGTIGQTQFRMVSAPRIGQTTIRQTAPLRIPNAVGPTRLTSTNITPIRPGTIVQTNNLVQSNQPLPALHPVSGTTIISGTTQIRTPATMPRPQTTVQIRQASPVVRPATQTNKNIIITSPSSSVVGQKSNQNQSGSSAVVVTTTANATNVVTATASIQLKQTATTNNIVLNNNNNNFSNNSNNNNNNNSNLSVNNLNNNNNNNTSKNHSQFITNSSSSSTTATATQIVINSNKSNNKLLLNSNSNSLPTVNSKSIAITSHVTSAPSPVSITPTLIHNNKTIHDKKSQNSSASLSASPALKSIRDKSDKKLFATGANASASMMGSGSGTASAAMVSSFYPTIYGDDDINDVAAMGGVNLAEESQRILGSTEYVGTQIRSCKDEVFLNLPALQQKIRACMAKHGLDEPTSAVAEILSHATQEHLKNIVEKLAVIAEHRIDILKIDPRYEMTSDVRGQIKFLEELDKAEQKRHDEYEREMLLRAAKSRSKTEDPEQAKLKAKAKEMQRAEMEELRHREANNTALQAIGPRKKPKLDTDTTTTTTGVSNLNSSTKTTSVPRPRIKRVNLRDMIFYLEQEKESSRSNMLYKAYLK